MPSLQAHLLIANPELPDPFSRSVVLLVRHNEEGALGLILNRQAGASLKQTWDRLSEIPCQRDDLLYLGGPCEGPLMALHARPALGEYEVMPGLYFCAGKDKLEQLASEDGSDPVKFLAGYSGWAAGQLENEIARGSWLILPATLDHVFQNEDELWEQTTRQVADASLRATLHIKEVPPDLRMN